MSSRLASRLRVIALALGNMLILRVRKRNDIPRRILVAHHLLLGDTIMLTPLLAKLRQQYPAAEIVMVAPKAAVPLYQKRPYDVIVMPHDPRDPATFHALRQKTGFDLAIVPGDNRYSWLAKALGARHIVAFSGDRPAYKSWPVDELFPYPDSPAAWGDMVAGLVPGPAPAPYRPDAWPDPDCTPFEPPSKPYCVLHVGASTPLKQWEKEKWLGLADLLEKQGLQVVWSGGRGEEKLVAGLDPEGRRLSYAGRLDLAQLWQLLKNAKLLVCPDTGVAHLGRLTGTPTVALFGPGSASIYGAGNFWRDSPYVAVTVDPFPCRDQHRLFKREIPWVLRCGRNPRECAAPRCMQAISLEAVSDAVRRLLDGNWQH
ncbi:heptosyltransferase [Sulfurimicrobium lacus]|uniref:Heptosyltransferase n=1 Tax=Sulfurimicrobium lacus TaxID=2715678 RepID=A0A6F8VIV1_9PROT|nr:glycosyltransferase family 9 protein [Sulfurimicrobium lacus]BCB28695.1 heptosyltransferase [Sulfurimicrobium lacus]